MNKVERSGRRVTTALDDTRTARAVVCKGGFSDLRAYLRQVRKEHLSRTGRFAGLPSQRPVDVRSAIEGARTTDAPLIDEIRSIRRGFSGAKIKVKH
jgi:hypothetical protein